MLTTVHPMFQNKQAVIFDLDGTLLDSMSLWHDVDVEFLGSYGLDVPADLMKTIGGMTFHDVAVYFKDRFHLSESIEEIMQIWDSMVYQKYSHSISMKPGARALLEQLQKEGYHIGIATANSRRLLEAALNAHGIGDVFDYMMTSDETVKGKPEPDVYLLTAEHLGVSPEACLVFEDIPVGIRAGKAAGMTVCAVGDAFSDDVKEEKINLADYYLDSLEELKFGL